MGHQKPHCHRICRSHAILSRVCVYVCVVYMSCRAYTCSVVLLCVCARKSSCKHAQLCAPVFVMVPHARKHVYAYTHTHEPTGAGNGYRKNDQARRGQRRALAAAHRARQKCTPKTQAAACAPRPARSAIGSPSASASGRGRVGRTAPQPRAAVPRARARGRLCRRVERTPKARIHLRSRRARGCTFAGRGRAPRRRGRVRHCVWWMLSRGWRT